MQFAVRRQPSILCCQRERDVERLRGPLIHTYSTLLSSADSCTRSSGLRASKFAVCPSWPFIAVGTRSTSSFSIATRSRILTVPGALIDSFDWNASSRRRITTASWAMPTRACSAVSVGGTGASSPGSLAGAGSARFRGGRLAGRERLAGRPLALRAGLLRCGATRHLDPPERDTLAVATGE